MADAVQRWEPATGGGQGAAEEVRSAATEKAEELKETVRQSSTQLSSTARGWVQQEADERTSAIASQARTIADAMRQTSSKLQQDGQPQAARLTDTIADRVDRAATYLDQADGDRLMNDVQDLARRNPWAFAAAGLLAGFAASRFMKASRPTPSRSSDPMLEGRRAGGYETQTAMSGGSYGTPASGSYDVTGGTGAYRGAYGESGSTGS